MKQDDFILANFQTFNFINFTNRTVFFRFVILGVMIEAGEGFCKVEKVTGDDGKPDLLITMDR